MDTTTPATPATIGKYTVLRVLGRGGMGEVLLAEDDLGRRVAIKRPFSGEGVARFNIEARATTLSHPNIPVVYELGKQDDGLPFMAMEFVEGEPLDKMISSGKPMDLMLKLSIVEQICAGLGYAHQKGIIHRDIKPANVIVLPNGVAKIIDFGIAKITNVEQTSELTQASQIIGSLHYIAPERFKAEAFDGRVDIFSAGVILFLLLTGQLPFSGGEMTASYRIVNEAHSALATHIKDYPKALDGIMDQALAKNPDDRFATAEDFADALREVIDDLKRGKISRLFSDAERLTMESRYEPALELLDEAMKLDSGNTQVRKLRKMVRDHQERRKRTERLRETIVKADSLLAAENYTEALAQLKEAQRIEPSSTDIRDRINYVEDKKLRFERAAAALAQIESTQGRGDITAALRIAERAVEDDPENTKLLAARSAIAKQLEREAIQNKINAILDSAQQEFGRRNFTAVETLLAEAAAIDASHPKIEELRSELTRMREAEERRQLMEEIQRRVNDFLRGDQYEQASELLNRAIDKLPGESTLHRLKMEVDTAARKFDSERFIDSAIATARQTFNADPEKAIAGLQSAIVQMPGEERLIAFERSLRQQADALRLQQMLSDTLRSARELLAAREPDKAIGALEAYQLEHGAQADLDELLGLARQELAGQQRRALIEKTSADVRNLVRDERLTEAVRLLESVLQSPDLRDSGDRTLSGLLEDVRKQQAAAAHKLDVLQKRAVMLRERGQLEESIQVLKEYLATNPRTAPVQELLASIEAEWERKQVTKQAIATAAQQSDHHNFPAAFEALESVVRAYGESDELTRAKQLVEQARSTYAQEVVGHSITGSRAALLKNDVPGALEALRSANEVLQFADEAKQADWRRIAQAAKKAEAEPPAAGAVIADPLADLPELETQRKPMSPAVLISGIVAVCIVLAVAGVLIFRKPAPAGPVGPTDAHLSIAKAQPGALVSIDSGTKKPIEANGSLDVVVSPGDHLLDVTMDGFQPYEEKFQVKAGETYREAISLQKVVAQDLAGTLAMQSNLAGFKVFIDGRLTGEVMKKDGTRTLEEGKHTVRYTNEDGSDAMPDHEIVITRGKTTNDMVALKAPAPPPPPPPGATGGIAIETTANAQVSVDGRSRGLADGSGRLTVNSLPAGNHTVDISLDKYQPISGRSVAVTANQVYPFRQPLTALPPPPVTPTVGNLSISTNPGAQVTLNGQPKGSADGSGQLIVPNLAPGSYKVEIRLDHYQPSSLTVPVIAGATTPAAASLAPVIEAPKETPKVAEAKPEPSSPPKEDNSVDYQGIQAALNNLVAAYKSKNIAAVQANWTNINPNVRKGLAGTFGVAEMVNFSESCEGNPVISGNTATQTCVESQQFFKSTPPNKSTKTITFAKVGGKWIVKDKN